MKKIGLVLVLIVIAVLVISVAAKEDFRALLPVVNSSHNDRVNPAGEICAYPMLGEVCPTATPRPTQTPYIRPTYDGPYPTVACPPDTTCK